MTRKLAYLVKIDLNEKLYSKQNTSNFEAQVQKLNTSNYSTRGKQLLYQSQSDHRTKPCIDEKLYVFSIF